MRIKNLIGSIFFAIVGAGIVLVVLYPYALEYLYLTDREPRPFGMKEIIFLSIAIVFFYGSAKFTSLADTIIVVWKSKFVKNPKEQNDGK